MTRARSSWRVGHAPHSKEHLFEYGGKYPGDASLFAYARDMAVMFLQRFPAPRWRVICGPRCLPFCPVLSDRLPTGHDHRLAVAGTMRSAVALLKVLRSSHYSSHPPRTYFSGDDSNRLSLLLIATQSRVAPCPTLCRSSFICV